MTKRISKNPEKYCRVAYKSLYANRDEWGTPDAHRPITRIMYDQVFSSGCDKTLGLISERAAALPKSKRCDDHYLSPQFVGRMVMDNQERFLNNYESFKEVFYLARRTIAVTKPENNALSEFTNNRSGIYRVYIPTDKKYEALGINLLTEDDSGTLRVCPSSTAYQHSIINKLLEYERDFLFEIPPPAKIKLEEKMSKLSGV
jgi:hypothetical protein